MQAFIINNLDLAVSPYYDADNYLDNKLEDNPGALASLVTTGTDNQDKVPEKKSKLRVGKGPLTTISQVLTWDNDKLVVLDGGQSLNSPHEFTGNELRTLEVYGKKEANGTITTVTLVGEDNDGSTISGDSVTLLLATGELVPDYNRDGKIDDDDRNKVDKDHPWRFWVNDDNDRGDMEGTDIPGGLLPIFQNLPVFRGIRDLVDWFPVYLNIKDVIKLFPPENYVYQMYQAKAAIFYAPTDIKRAETSSYLKNINVARSVLSKPGYPTLANDVYVTSSVEPNNVESMIPEARMKTDVIRKIADGEGIILVSACKETTEPLVLRIIKNGKIMVEFKLELSISGVEKMFRHKNLIYGGEAGNIVASRSDAPNWPNELCNDKNFIFVHGYNVNQEQARGWAAEMFKKMWQSGSKARFHAITWNGAKTQIADTATINYHINVRNALDTTEFLAEYLNSLEGVNIIAAHSLGNMLVLGALNPPKDDLGKFDFAAARISQVFSLDAAVAAESIDGTIAMKMSMIHSDWDSGNQDKLPEWLWSSEWHRLFTDGDYRQNLTWQNRLAETNGAVIYNFYSSGEEVLDYTAEKPTRALLGAAVEILGITSGPIGTNAWYYQELFKGRHTIDGLIGSSYGGWGFGTDYVRTESTGGQYGGSIKIRFKTRLARQKRRES